MQKSKRKMSSIEKKYMVAGFAFLMPAIVIYLIFAVIPFFDSFILSFQEWSGFGPRSFLGFKNYISAFRDKTFLMAIRNSVYLGVTSAFFSVIIGVLMAWLLL
ncbi:carbohydrate ABC transporter permease, partial [Hungatella hathewayi]